VRDGQHGVVCPECDTFIATVQRKDFESFAGTEYQQHYAEHHTAAGRLKALAAEAIRLAEDEDAWGTERQIEASIAYVDACEAAGYRWEEDPEAVDYAYVGAKATEAEMTAFTLPRALRALEGA
jgi:hypothetical protein